MNDKSEQLNNIDLSEEHICPFCKETDFDLIGLKIHITFGHCDQFNNLSIDIPKTREVKNEC